MREAVAGEYRAVIAEAESLIEAPGYTLRIGMLAPWPSVPLTAIIGMKRGNPKEAEEMWKPLIRKSSPSEANKLRAAQLSVTLVPRREEASMASRMGLPKSFLGLVVGVALLAALGSFASAASSQNQTPRQAKPFHLTKECSGFSGKAGGYCTIRSANVKAIKVGSKIFYFQPDTKTGTDSDMVIYVERGTVAIGHCDVASATGLGLCTISDGTGALAGFHLRVRVSPHRTVPNLWRWDGTYGFSRG